MVWSKESRQARGYDKKWDRIRQQVIKRDYGQCQECKRQGRVTVGREVDHIVSKAKSKVLGWTRSMVDALSNLELLCKRCHDEKTARDEGRIYRPKMEIGLDGWPIE